MAELIRGRPRLMQRAHYAAVGPGERVITANRAASEGQTWPHRIISDEALRHDQGEDDSDIKLQTTYNICEAKYHPLDVWFTRVVIKRCLNAKYERQLMG
eukprot:scaffold46971_cov38-Prasinocladus_malaysianus.AAC.1